MLLRDYPNGDTLALPLDSAYLTLVRDILENPEVQSMKAYVQHGRTSCLQHSVNVSWLSYRYCRKRRGYDADAVARAGMLHDLFLYDWHDRNDKRRNFHGFTHPRRALGNARRLFQLSPLECSIILRHMWPLTVVPPRHKEAFVLSLYDKYCSLCETMHRTQAVVFGASDGNPDNADGLLEVALPDLPEIVRTYLLP